MRPLLFHRLHDITPMLLVAVGLGVLQVLLGIFMGFLNNIKLRHYKHAIYELARFLGIGGIIVAVLSLAKVLPHPGLWVGLALILVSLPAVVWVEGFIAPLEMLSAIGNMMSFARLMAIGMASAILAMIANIFYSKIPLLIGGLIVALLFHTLNTVLGIFDPTIQGLRLQFVEFFSKFYVTGTKAFKPLRIGGKDYVS
jgi:V/A-type H+-transporting ATPase subunit I